MKGSLRRVWVSDLQRPDSDSQNAVTKADGGGPIPTRTWIAGGQNFSLAGAEVEFMLPVRVVPGAAPATHNMVVSAFLSKLQQQAVPAAKDDEGGSAGHHR